jgi:spore maturation protein CgeB
MRDRPGVSLGGGRVTSASILIVGNPGEVHVGRHLLQAAQEAGIQATLCDTTAAYAGSKVQRTYSWRLRGHRPANLAAFSGQVVTACRDHKPAWIIATGLAPVDAESLRAIGDLGIRRVNFLTDDPWNRAHYAPWFMEAVTEYDAVFTPRRANVEDLRALGCRQVTYLPFAYAPDIHFSDPPVTTNERLRYDADVVFVGGADRDRVEWITPLISAGFRVALYGGYWERHSQTRTAARGMADAATVRKAIGGGATTLCLVRRANRDGHSMRSFEVPAIGACMLVEDTPEHREIFGHSRTAVDYVKTPEDAVQRVRVLLGDRCERDRLTRSAHALIASGHHTWSDRLKTMLKDGRPW